jgi:hypothetical protein
MIEAMRAYDPINVLKAVESNVWIVDGPIIRVAMCGFRMPFPTRMTIVRLGDRELKTADAWSSSGWIHLA